MQYGTCFSLIYHNKHGIHLQMYNKKSNFPNFFLKNKGIPIIYYK